MASDLSSECTEAIGVLDEKEEGEISLEDVSSSEEGHINYGYGSKTSQCSNCLSTQHNATWCTVPAKFYPPKGTNRREVDLIPQDAVQGKENRHQIKESGCIGTKHTTSTLQEKNDDLVPISSDSDMEIVGLADNSKQITIHSSAKSRMKKKRKKKRNHISSTSLDDLVSSSTVDISIKECINTIKHDVTKNSSRSHHREISPIHRSNRSKVIPRSPPKRHRSLIKPRSPFRRSKSPIIRTRSPTIRRSPRRLKSPKRSPYKSSTKTMPRKTSHIELISSRNYVDTHKLLKKVRQLGSIGTHSLEETLNKNKEHASSLKEKLTNMMKGVSDNNIDLTNSSKEKTIINVNKKESNDNIDDEEDLALLRQKALETKQNKSNKQNDVSKTETSKHVSANINDDQDEEDLELRMIALRSAVLKKHQNRIQKGIKSGKYKKSDTFRSESPFTQSFLDSIPIPGEELLNFASPPHSPLPINENNHTEDMELDTDVEREKEKLPYSPTDKITANIPMDTELLGIQPSDVSFITVNEANNSPNFNTSVTSSQDDQKSYQGKIIENQSYLPNIVYYTPSQNSLCVTNTNVQYLPTDLSETSKPDFMKIHNSHLNISPYENICIAKNNNNTSEALDINSSQEMPYSPTDTPIYDPDLSHALPQTLGALTISNSSLVSLESYISNTHGSNEQHNHISTDQHIQPTKDVNNENEHLNKTEVLSLEPVANFTTTSLMETLSPSSSMITIDDLPEIEADIHLTDTVRNLKTEYIPNDLSNNIDEKIVEPLYMKGLPDVTKDTNKIPTLINRTLVPAPILKTNKQLQLPLPTKKNITQQEPTFKSAEMQPVVLHEETSTKTNASFKPIKLTSFLQKSHSVLAIPTAFHDSLHEDLINETSADKSSHTSLIETNPNVTLVQNNTIITNSEKTSDIKSPTPKKKKLSKKGLKKRSTGSALIAKNHNTTCIKSDNVNIVDKHESQQVLYTDNKQDQKEIQIEMDQTDNIDVSMSETSKNIIIEKNNISSESNEKDIQNNDNSVNDISEQIKGTEDRRQSLDEDEEALRAILLASLPKRTKITNNCSNSDTISTASTTLNQVLVNQTVSNIVLPTANLSIPHVNLYGSENDKNQSNSGEKINNIIQKDLSVDNNKTLNITTLGRKRSINITKGPQRKLIKRISIPASTKVVNNAKKYQNTMIQKRLNLQKSTLYNKQKITENKILSKVQSNDSKWSANSKALSDTQRIVINLESDTESDSESERQKNITVSSVHSVITEKHQPTINSTTEFEKNLDQFLRAVRRKQESMAAARPTSISQTPKKDTVLTTKSEKLNSSNNLHTPLAVRHLPVSQQEEYRRLKQQILEREKLKLHKTMENNSLIKNKNMEIFSKSTLSNSQNKELCIKINQISTKSQNINTQQLNKENCSKNLIDSIKNTAISTNNVQSCSKTCNVVDKRENTNPNQTKLLSKSTTNNDVCVSIENNPNNIRNKVVENSVQSTSTRKIFEMPAQKIEMKTRISPGLKILSIDEVNQKYVQIQVKNDTNERVVTINDKVSLNNKAVINRNENISGYKDNNNKNTCDHDINNMLSTNNIISNDNNAVDSDASTVILSERHQDRKENLDTSESTISLSQHQEDLSSISNAENSHFLFIQNNISSKDTKSIEENWDEIKKDVKTELNTLINLSRAEQEQHLIDTEEKLVMKRYTILDDLAEMSSNLRQWHMERDLQTNLVAEVKKLREQLKVAEERLQVQRNRINNIGPRVVAAHEKVNAGRQECFKLATICSTLGSRIMGKEYKVPEAGAQLLDNRLKEVANHTRQLSRKKVPSIDISDMYELSRLEEETVSTTCTEISQNKSLLLEECNIDRSILNEDQSRIKSSDIEKNIQIEEQIEDITINKNKTDKETDIILNISTLNFDERCISKQNDIEQKIFEETNLTNNNTTTTNILKPEDIQKLDNNMSENNIIRPTILKPDTKKRNSTKFEGELQRKKTLLSYESILTHFKIPRNTNPNGVLCPYELMGTCSDGDCQFIHQTESQTK